jgi:hypothetical protein
MTPRTGIPPFVVLRTGLNASLVASSSLASAEYIATVHPGHFARITFPNCA